MANTNQGTSDAGTIFTILALVFFYPLGILLAWFWTKWPTGVKIIVSLPIIAILAAIMLIVANPAGKSKNVNSPSTVITTPTP